MAIHKTSDKVQIFSISIPLFLVKLLDQLTKIYRHVYTKVLLQKKVSNFEIPSDNPTFKENTPRIYTNINTSKLKPDSNDTLHTFQKLTSLRLNLILSKVLLLGKYLI